MGKTMKRLTAVFLAAVLLAGLAPAWTGLKTSLKAEAAYPDPATVVTVNRAEEVKDLLEQDGDVYIRLSGDATLSIDDWGKGRDYAEPGFNEGRYTACWCHVGQGNRSEEHTV